MADTTRIGCEPTFEAFAALPGISDLPRPEQWKRYRTAWSCMISAKTAGLDQSYDVDHWKQAIRGKGIKGYGRDYGAKTPEPSPSK